MFEAIKKSYANLPDKKKWIDLLVALLTVPVLVTVIVANLNNIKKKDEVKSEPVPTPQIVVELPREREATPTPSPISPSPTATGVNCSGEVSPWEIKKPAEGETVKADPVVVEIEFTKDKEYCVHEWAYRVNESSFTTYSSNPVYLYNMALGPVRLELKVRNKVSGKESSLVRNFIYKEEITATPTATVTPAVTPATTP